ncbi:MAG: EF-Tu/IF-2/RF-3 family GTPase [Desulfobacterota bacterium]|nr:EF-Tu/IF-2/RF-3 family GTPase [Thermodesulfobacteriota bacterium]MDW8001176.1 EF-Tu/IF-2/RF-3 family GTPase [Deltaproteobacteria bacterium]
MEEIAVGKVEKFFSKIGVAAIRIVEGELKIGDTIRIKGHTTDFEQKIESMQIEHTPVDKAVKGENVGIKVKEKVREGDTVYLLKE